MRKRLRVRATNKSRTSFQRSSPWLSRFIFDARVVDYDNRKTPVTGWFCKRRFVYTVIIFLSLSLSHERFGPDQESLLFLTVDRLNNDRSIVSLSLSNVPWLFFSSLYYRYIHIYPWLRLRTHSDELLLIVPPWPTPGNCTTDIHYTPCWLLARSRLNPNHPTIPSNAKSVISIIKSRERIVHRPLLRRRSHSTWTCRKFFSFSISYNRA